MTLASGQFGHGPLLGARQADHVEQFSHALCALRPWHPLQLKGEADVVSHAEVGEQLAILEDEAKAAPVSRQVRHFLAVPADRTRRVDDASQSEQER